MKIIKKQSIVILLELETRFSMENQKAQNQLDDQGRDGFITCSESCAKDRNL